MKKKDFWERLGSVVNLVWLIVAVIVGIAGAYVLGSVFGMGMSGYALGFVLGVGITVGGISIG